MSSQSSYRKTIGPLREGVSVNCSLCSGAGYSHIDDRGHYVLCGSCGGTGNKTSVIAEDRGIENMETIFAELFQAYRGQVWEAAKRGDEKVNLLFTFRAGHLRALVMAAGAEQYMKPLPAQLFGVPFTECVDQSVPWVLWSMVDRGEVVVGGEKSTASLETRSKK